MNMVSGASDPLQKMKGFYKERGRMPSYSEIASLFGFASKQAAHRLAEKLIKAGDIAKDAQGRLIPRFHERGLSLLGYVQAGFPSPAEEELIDQVTIDQYLVRRPEESFLLKVSGDSMIEAGILPGDIVIIERGKTPQTGDIVLAEIDREWTLKYYRMEGGQVVLIPANPRYPELRPQEQLQIAGIAAGVIRRYR
jgi:SOS regulatory protein LexA